jgi:hypothetical protein
MKASVTLWTLLGTLALLTPAVRGDDRKEAPKPYQPGEPFPCCEQCGRPRLTCTVEEKAEKVKKSCWEVKCKEICIPAVTFPWQKKHGCCRPARCGKVRIIHVLEKKEYEVEQCRCKWNLEPTCECPRPRKWLFGWFGHGGGETCEPPAPAPKK